ncbi:MAG TPA: hypothetical protein VIJ22_15295, partial [Polyangiaceae bacterium]
MTLRGAALLCGWAWGSMLGCGSRTGIDAFSTRVVDGGTTTPSCAASGLVVLYAGQELAVGGGTPVTVASGWALPMFGRGSITVDA